MSIDHLRIVDAALLLDRLADVLELLPGMQEDWLNEERSDVARSCRQAAQLVAVHDDTGQSYEAAKGYAGSEWRNAVLRSLVGAENAQRLLLTSCKQRTPHRRSNGGEP